MFLGYNRVYTKIWIQNRFNKIARWWENNKETFQSHMRMFKCLLEELKAFAKLRTESRELVSISKTWKFESGCCSSRLSFTFNPLSRVLAGMITFAPLKDNTRAVSFPIPFVAPKHWHICLYQWDGAMCWHYLHFKIFTCWQ